MAMEYFAKTHSVAGRVLVLPGIFGYTDSPSGLSRTRLADDTGDSTTGDGAVSDSDDPDPDLYVGGFIRPGVADSVGSDANPTIAMTRFASISSALMRFSSSASAPAGQKTSQGMLLRPFPFRCTFFSRRSVHVLIIWLILSWSSWSAFRRTFLLCKSSRITRSR